MNEREPECSRPRSRRPKSLGNTGLEKSLSAYVGAAVAAGVSLLALGPSAEGKIVYTPANLDIPVDEGALPLDVNHDGIADFFFSNVIGCLGGVDILMAGTKEMNNHIWGRGTGTICGFGRFLFASALHAGFPVGSHKSRFQNGPYWLMGMFAGSRSSSTTFGQWLYTKHRYLGLRFSINGQIHYGWARVSVGLISTGLHGGIQATLTGYAYETIPNKPIITGKIKGPDVVVLPPASLGHLAQGASAIPAWRGKK
jgi:hypothetical protein